MFTSSFRKIRDSMSSFYRAAFKRPHLEHTNEEAAFEAVRDGKLPQLRRLVQFGKVNVNIQEEDYQGRTLLITSIEYEQVEIFHYLLSLDDINLDQPNNRKETPLHCACDKEYFAFELLRKGANPFYKNKQSQTLLHYLTLQSSDSNLKLGQLLIEKGVDINARDSDGYTALSYASKSLKVGWVCMLLYYGADATVHTNDFLLPLFIMEPPYCNPDRVLSDIQFLQDILFDYTFDNFKTTVSLENLIMAIHNFPKLFYKTLGHISGVEFKSESADILNSLCCEHGEEFKLLADKFTYILKEIVDSVPIFLYLIEHCCEPFTMKMIIDVFLQSDFVSDFVQNSEFNDLLSSPIGRLIKVYGDEISLDEITTQILIMLSYGLEVNSLDLEVVYTRHGHCPLFKFLLSMNIIKVDLSQYDEFHITCRYFEHTYLE